MKSLSKLSIEDSVYNRIEGRVAVAEPEDDPKQRRGNGQPCEQRDRVDEEEWQPTSYERGYDHSEDKGSPAFPRSSQATFGTLAVPHRVRVTPVKVPPPSDDDGGHRLLGLIPPLRGG